MDVGGSVVRLGVVAAGVLVVAAACTGPSGVANAQGAPPTLPTTGAVASPSAAAQGAGASTATGGSRTPACRTADMAVRLGRPSSAKFEEGTVIELANTGQPCTVSGYLGLRLLDDHGAPMPTRVDKLQDGTSVRPVMVAGGGRAYATLVWQKYEGQGTTCPPYPAILAVSLPGQAATVTAPWFTGISASACDGALRVSALRPTQD